MFIRTEEFDAIVNGLELQISLLRKRLASKQDEVLMKESVLNEMSETIKRQKQRIDELTEPKMPVDFKPGM